VTWRITGLLLAMACMVSPAVSAQACGPGDLFALVAERLSQMPAVAEYKYARELPVSDPAREQRVLESASARARELGIPPAQVRPFILAQVEAARFIQRRLMREWEQQGRSPVKGGADLVATIRPRLIRLGQQQLQAIQCLRERGARIEPRHRREFDAAVAGANLSGETAERLFQSLQLAVDDPSGDQR
jgi:chorismate mutase